MLPVQAQAQMHMTDSVQTSAPCPALAGGGAEGRSLSEELNVAPLVPPGADDGACAAVGATQSTTDVYPANDAPAPALRNTTGTSCFPFPLVCSVIETPPPHGARRPARIQARVHRIRCCSRRWLVVVCGAHFCGGYCVQLLRCNSAWSNEGVQRYAFRACCGVYEVD